MHVTRSAGLDKDGLKERKSIGGHADCQRDLGREVMHIFSYRLRRIEIALPVEMVSSRGVREYGTSKGAA
jgi:hypothetical protein